MRLALACAAVLLGAVACEGGGPPAADVRGAGRPIAKLSPAHRAAAYDAAIRQAFDIEPGLVLMADSVSLPRTGGAEAGRPLPSEVLTRLRSNGTIQGLCSPASPAEGKAPTCDATAPGYVVRLSDVFQLGRDTVRLYVRADRYQLPAGGGPSARFAFEDGYELVRAGGGWNVIRRARRSGL